MNRSMTFRSGILEFKKSNLLLNLLMVLFLIGIDLAYMIFGIKGGTDVISQGWEQTLFSVPLVNVLFLSIFMAILASRTMDLEHKGCTWNLLQTLESRQAIFFGKSLYGLFWIVLSGFLQMAMIIVFGRMRGFSDNVPVLNMIIMVASEIVAGMVVYQIGCLLSLLFASQFAALSINLGGMLCGFFLIFVTDAPVTPWSILPALSVVEMKYQEAEQTAFFEWAKAPVPYWILSFLYLFVIITVGAVVYTRMEEGTLSIFQKGDTHKSSIHTSLPAELIKLRRSPVWIAFFVIPVISAAIGTFNFKGNQGVLSFTWESLWTQHSLFLGIFFLPPLIGILCSLLWRMEHTGTNWNVVLCNESVWKVVKDKLLVASAISILCVIWIGVLYIGCGIGVGLSSLPPLDFYKCIFCAALSCIAISSVQLFLSLVIRPFAVPIGIALGGSAMGIAFVVKGWIYALPYAILQSGLKSTNMERELSIGKFIIAVLTYVLIFYFLSVLYLKKTDAKTCE